MTKRTVAPLGRRAYVAKKVENDARQNGQYCEPGISGHDTEVIQWLVRANMKILEGSLPSSKMEYTLSQIGSTIINGDECDHRKINGFNSEGVVKHQRQRVKA